MQTNPLPAGSDRVILKAKNIVNSTETIFEKKK